MSASASRIRRTVLLAVCALVPCALGVALGGLSEHGTQPELEHPLSNSTSCRGCHGNDFDPDHAIEPSETWGGTMMANSARDPIFWAALDVANHDVPGIGSFCLRCHAPGAWLAGRSGPPGGTPDGCGLNGQIDDPFSSDFDGVTCHLCHRMMIHESPPAGQSPFYLENAELWIDDGDCDGAGEPCRRGPYAYNSRDDEPPHPYRHSPYHSSSSFCGSCHNVTSPLHNLIVDGVDQGMRFPIERTYKEWAQSSYAAGWPVQKTCQSCHMPESGVDGAYACVFRSNDRTGDLPVHRFAGGNAWVPEILRGEYPNLGRFVEFEQTALAARDMLAHQAAQVEITVPAQFTEGAPLAVAVRVTNRTGHKLPTGYAEGRRMWNHIAARDGAGATFWESGAYDSKTGVLGRDPSIKVYRAEQGVWNLFGDGACDVEDDAGRPLFHFARNDCVTIDNRIPPLGFRGGSDLETKPVGYSYPEMPPGSGILAHFDVTQYSIPVPPGAASPVTVTARLLYQTASKEYVEFLRDEALTHGFPDDCIERSSGPATQSRGAILYDLWTAYGRSAPTSMGSASGQAVLVRRRAPGGLARPAAARD